MRLQTKEDLKSILREEKKLYLLSVSTDIEKAKRIRHKRFYIWKYLYFFRMSQFYMGQKRNAKGFKRRIYKVISVYYDRRKNILSMKAGVEIGNQCQIGRCIDIWHGGVVINGNIGDGCVFHGNNIIGNKGLGRETSVPNLGKKVDVGAGATVIGNITIADNVKIGAGAVVVKSENQEGSILVGVPAKSIN